MPVVLLTSQAERDRLEIILTIAEDNPLAADRLLDAIDEKCRLLARTPELGRKRFELAAGLRSLAIGNYVIFYRPAAEGIQVIRVLHGARDIPGQFQ